MNFITVGCRETSITGTITSTGDPDSYIVYPIPHDEPYQPCFYGPYFPQPKLLERCRSWLLNLIDFRYWKCECRYWPVSGVTRLVISAHCRRHD